MDKTEYDRSLLKRSEKKASIWIHFGGENLYRGFHAKIAYRLANYGELNSGVIICETPNNEVVEKIYCPFNNDVLEVSKA